MSDPDEQIETARRQVQEGRRIVARQRERIANGNASGVDAEELLGAFELLLDGFELALNRLLPLPNVMTMPSVMTTRHRRP